MSYGREPKKLCRPPGASGRRDWPSLLWGGTERLNAAPRPPPKRKKPGARKKPSKTPRHQATRPAPGQQDKPDKAPETHEGRKGNPDQNNMCVVRQVVRSPDPVFHRPTEDMRNSGNPSSGSCTNACTAPTRCDNTCLHFAVTHQQWFHLFLV